MVFGGCAWKIEIWEGVEQSVYAVILVSGCRQWCRCEGQAQQNCLYTNFLLE